MIRIQRHQTHNEHLARQNEHVSKHNTAMPVKKQSRHELNS